MVIQWPSDDIRIEFNAVGPYYLKIPSQILAHIGARQMGTRRALSL